MQKLLSHACPICITDFSNEALAHRARYGTGCPKYEEMKERLYNLEDEVHGLRNYVFGLQGAPCGGCKTGTLLNSNETMEDGSKVFQCEKCGWGEIVQKPTPKLSKEEAEAKLQALIDAGPPEDQEYEESTDLLPDSISR